VTKSVLVQKNMVGAHRSSWILISSTESLTPHATQLESKVFLKMKGDHFRYLFGVASGDNKQTALLNSQQLTRKHLKLVRKIGNPHSQFDWV
uniref:Uncharacterized protein n=1 Tax=Theropithecus gelada TaxID=9565 RepID=A0A8D2FG04_THEGE